MAKVPGTFVGPVEGKLKRDLSPASQRAEGILVEAGALHAERWLLGRCTIMLAREPVQSGGFRWHLSIAHPTRHPTWDETKTTVFGIDRLEHVTMAQILRPEDNVKWLNEHEHCFHWFEVQDSDLLGWAV